MRLAQLNRRDFAALIAGAAGWPVVARAQQAAVPVIGLLTNYPLNRISDEIAALRQGLRQSGFVEGRNVSVIYSSSDTESGRLLGLAAELVRRKVDVIVTSTNAAALAAKAATTTIPIVFGVGDSPVDLGLVANLNHPGGNITGVTTFFGELVGKRFELLHELVPRATTITALLNPTNTNAEFIWRDVDAAARALRLQVRVLRASTGRDIDAAFAMLVHPADDVLLVSQDPFFYSQSEKLVSMATSHSVPAIYPRPEYVAAGGLISYAPADQDSWAGIYASRILKGERPGDLPVIQPTKFKLSVNLKAAKALGLTVPPSLLARADEVIE
jgi:putative ABC transport system substrate-binding protein